jgi:hypothetical protein
MSNTEILCVFLIITLITNKYFWKLVLSSMLFLLATIFVIFASYVIWVWIAPPI